MESKRPGNSRSRRLPFILLALIVTAVLLAWMGCPGSPPPNQLHIAKPDLYDRMVSAFSDAVYALQVCDQHRISVVVPRPTQIYPDEPAGWINVAVMKIRINDAPAAKKALQKARELAPNNADAEYIDGMLEKLQYHMPQAAVLFEKAINIDPNYLKARYGLFEASVAQGTPETNAKAVEQLKAILQTSPQNVVVLLELAKLQAVSDPTGLRETVVRLTTLSSAWKPDARAKLTEIAKAVAANKATPSDLIVVWNVVKGEPQAQLARMELTTLDSQARVDPIDHFIKLKNPPPGPAAPDDKLSFTEQPMLDATHGPLLARTITLAPELRKEQADPYKLLPADEGPTGIVIADSAGLTISIGGQAQRISFPLAGPGQPINRDTILFTDWSYQYRQDFILAGHGGLAFFRQGNDRKYVDVTSKTGLPQSILRASYGGAWPIDIEADSDLDIVLGSKSSTPVVLRNNGDGTFTPINPFPGVSGVTAFAWLDIDGDYAPDAALVDGQGKLHVFRNILSGSYIEWPAPEGLGKVISLAVADFSQDGVLDLAALQTDGRIARVSRNRDQSGWDVVDMATWPNVPKDGSARILTADLDNNGAADLIATGSSRTEIWLLDSNSKALQLASPISARSVFITDATPQGRVDFTGITADGKPVRLVNKGTRSYNAYLPRPRAVYVADKDKSGTHRINTFGLGGEIRVRAGRLAVTAPITGPQVHVGIGANKTLDAIEYAWPDGSMQGEFEAQVANLPKGALGPPLPINQSIYTPKRLKGSCPWLFAWNGKRMEFVTDVLWGSPLGLKINAQDTAGVAETRDWVKVRSDQLVPHDGYYDLRITAELWETHYFDTVKLMTVDHPAGTEIFLDERFAIPFPPKNLFTTSPLKPVARAIDDRGADVTKIVNKRDGRYLDTFGVGEYQGITRDHYVELDLDSTANIDTAGPHATGSPFTRSPAHPLTLSPRHPVTPPLTHSLLVCQGWIHPTDSSINVAISQGKHDPPRSLSLEVPDGKGGWRIAKQNLGFPMGKNKTVMIDLAGAFTPGTPRKARLRTNLEIYWDFIGTANAIHEADLKTNEISASACDLQFRGFSAISAAGTSSPEVPDYNDIVSTGHPWVDLEGFYTRFGDVKELLNKVDDRYVILNAGDEIRLRFPEQAPPPTGWVRDYVFICDGWEKDGNYNTGFCRTVLPLPSHSNPAYNKPPGRLEDDPVYRRYPNDWAIYHTRYVTPFAGRRSFLPAESVR